MCVCSEAVLHLQYAFFFCDILHATVSLSQVLVLLWFMVEIPVAGNMLSKLRYKQLVGSRGKVTVSHMIPAAVCSFSKHSFSSYA